MVKNVFSKVVGCVAVLVMLCLTLPAVGAVVNVSGAVDTQDTWVNDFIDGSKDYNYGASAVIEIGDLDGDADTYDDDQRHGLIKFDLTGVAALATIGQKVVVNSATLTMYYTGSGDPDIVVAFYPILAGNADWVEGSGNGTAAANNVEPNWGYKTNHWDFWASGQDGLLGENVDFIDTDPNFAPLMDCVDNDQIGVDASATATLIADVVTGWINDAASNGGLLFKQKVSTTSLVTFASSDNGDAGKVPVLSIDYSIVPLECGDTGTGLLEADLSGPGDEADCKVDSFDLAAFMSEWLDCSNPFDAQCN